MDPLDPQGETTSSGANNLHHLHTMGVFQCILEGGQVDLPFN